MTKTCKNMSALGGCQMHNLHCGYPACLTEDSMQPVQRCEVPPEGWTCSRQKGHDGPCAASPVGQLVIINGMFFSHSEILKWREQEVAYRDRHADDIAIDTLAQAMKNKMARMRERGRSGWDDKTQCTEESLAQMLVKSISKGDPVDVANFAMMLFNRGATDLTLSSAMLDAYVDYHQVIDQATRKAKAAMGIVELPRILVEIYIDMQNNASRYTVDRRVTTEERLLKLIEIKDEPVTVSNNF